ncbi:MULTISPECIES: hypothetical protein [unclassified Psychrobacter]|uniref:hypothetical protein n=1 Tax=unclassified Psychrobacter TaxID=196806 RepID=UPI000C33AE63|nr:MULTISPECIES: hypothetical protein [unclassified Psychrobacter]MBA6243811.1 hypothetical protein [Psychrobacter sp. Urea-trap-18]MBA6285394.1 hypothetical protein [Psychrobacter sp. Urea-trap-16]MBA6319086.1 hypothetical protein [Psychrobacter sp. Urea-trap-20]MBA6335105.1 hypothetical protein [Psychrobacter sp. Urea-trap-19]PKG59524.1 hypothetical protein CXF63_11300 [Psychrobacter sp. Choline-3u-12]
MRLKDRISELTKDYIVFPDLLYGLSSANNEPLWDVVKYLDCEGFDTLNVFSSGPRYEMLPNLNSQEIIHDFLESIMVAMPEDNLDWVLADSDSLDGLTVEEEQELIKLFNKGATTYFKVSDLLSFEPLNGLLHFLDVEHTVKDESVERPIDRLVEEEHKKYIAVNKFVNDLSKSESFGAGHPLKITVKYILENYINDFHLYRLKNKVYSLVSQTNNCKYKSASEILRSVYDTLDDYQIGTVKADREPFRDFYFAYSEVGHLVSSDLEKVRKENPINVEKQSSVNSVELLKKDYVMNDLGENQRLLITYPLFTEEEIACLIIDENPTCINHNDNYLRHSRMVSKAIEGGLLNPNDSGQISAKQTKTWLASYGFVYEGFNDGTLTYADELAEMTEEAIEANIKILNLTAKLEDAELDSIIHSHPAHKFLLKDAQATIDQLLKENTELRADKKIESSQPKQVSEVGERTIESLIEKNEQLTAEFNKARAEVNKLKNQLKETNDHRTNNPTSDHVVEFDWCTLNKAIYPPELHLALVLWQQMYQSNKIQNTYHNSHNSRFEVAAKSLGLDSKSSLGKRLNTVTNPVRSKMGQYALAKQLWDIKILNVPVVLAKKTKK